VLAPAFARIGAAGADGTLWPEAWTEGLAASGLGLHAYTFRRERVPAPLPSLEALLGVVFPVLDGVFCDQPDVAVAVRERLASRVC
jgi:hypothetical protein